MAVATPHTSQPLNILHLTAYAPPAWAYGGVVGAVGGLATAQVGRGHHVTILTTDAGSFESRLPAGESTYNGVRIVRCRNLIYPLRARYNLSTPLGYGRAFRRLAAHANVIHVHELRTAENVIAALSGPPRRLILSPHGTLSYTTGRGGFKTAWDRLLGRAVMRRISAGIALTETEQSEIRALWAALGLNPPPTYVIPNGVGEDVLTALTDPALPAAAQTLRVKWGLGNGPVILFLGRLHERKGIQFLIPAFGAIAAAFPDARLLIAGADSGMLAAGQRLAAECGVSDQVVFPGLLSGLDRIAALHMAAIFALPAIGEGLSVAALEALAAGVPALLTPGCNLPEITARGAGLVVEREIGAVAAGLRTLLSDESRRRVMGEAGAAWVRAVFTWPKIAEQVESVYGGETR